jgi:hypothetical protein
MKIWEKINLIKQVDKQMKSRKETLKKSNNMEGIITYLSILTLNVNGLNSSIERHTIANWTKKQHLTICCLQEMHLTDKNKY